MKALPGSSAGQGSFPIRLQKLGGGMNSMGTTAGEHWALTGVVGSPLRLGTTSSQEEYRRSATRGLSAGWPSLPGLPGLPASPAPLGETWSVRWGHVDPHATGPWVPARSIEPGQTLSDLADGDKTHLHAKLGMTKPGGRQGDTCPQMGDHGPVLMETGLCLDSIPTLPAAQPCWEPCGYFFLRAPALRSWVVVGAGQCSWPVGGGVAGELAP